MLENTENFYTSPKSNLKTNIDFERTHGKDVKFTQIIQELVDTLLSTYLNNDYKYDVDLRVDHLNTVVLGSISDITIGCGCFKELDENTVEVKRMFVNPYFRGLGVASGILDEIIAWATELSYTTLVLETGTLQEQAIKLFKKHGFTEIENFGPYIGIPGSICMARNL